MRGRRVGRISLKDTQRGNDRAIRGLALMSGRDLPPELLNNVPDAKPRAPRKPSGKPLEADILRDILKALRKHPLVATVDRRQSGVFRDGDRYIRVGRRGDSDISGILKGGRAYAIEVKRPGAKPNDKQIEFLRCIRDAGGIAGIAHSVAEAIAIIEADSAPI